MGFMDKAKKMAEQAAAQGKVLAEQAQTKLDEVQGDFNQKQTAHQQSDPATPAVEYDKHGRPVGESAAPPAPAPPAAPAEAAAPVPSGDPLAPPPTEAAAPPPPAPPAPAAPPAAPSAGSGLTSGDPLAG